MSTSARVGGRISAYPSANVQSLDNSLGRRLPSVIVRHTTDAGSELNAERSFRKAVDGVTTFKSIGKRSRRARMRTSRWN